MDDQVSLDRAAVCKLLQRLSATVFQEEEEQHPWRRQSRTFDQPLLRLWDHNSGIQLDEDGFENLAHLWFQRRRGPFTLTVVDSDIRIRNGLPVLHVSDEMEYYHVPDPYDRTNEYYKDHYICLSEVTKKEIVGHWRWEVLVENANWYEEIVIPAFERKRKAVESEDLSNLFTRLSHSPSELFCFFDDEVDGFDEPCGCFEDGSDTDDEVEEANATDDMFKIMEGDW
ncbi:hypothetical protein FOPE_09809 [Fonsecaea pedrosoi]|nr:hypothetical protein FOPE_09809 [Fonsecaea pedrosoi]